MTSQIKEKITYYQELMGRSWTDRAELLDERQENLIHIRY